MADRISVDRRIMGCVPRIAGTRVPVATIVGLLDQGRSIDEVLADYATVTREDVLAASVSALVRDVEPPAPSDSITLKQDPEHTRNDQGRC